MDGINLQFTRQGTFWRSVKICFLSRSAERRCYLLFFCFLFVSEMNVSFLLTETRLGDIRFKKWENRQKRE
jgi:hypothetical protein